MTYWAEVRATVRRSGPPRLVPLADVDRYTGFRSIVAYDDATADRIREQSSTADLRGTAVYADTLFVDFDGHDPLAFRKWLQGSGLAWQEYDSGNRSVHLHIPLTPICGAWVTDAMKVWTRQHAPTADISFLHPAGMYRLPGTYHPKQPGRRKELVAEAAGAPLALPEPTERQYTMPKIAASSRDEFFAMLTQQQGEGHRRPFLWRLATTGAEAGMEFDEVYEHACFWNERFCIPPHEDSVVLRQCESAFKRLGRRAG